MVARNKLMIQEDLKDVIKSGFAHAANSFSKMVENPILCKDFNFSQHAVNSSFSFEKHFEKVSNVYLIVETEVFGDVFGKSYLIISKHEFDFITRNIPEEKPNATNLKLEFIKELDNILSASFITMLSNQLDVKVYGDIPLLINPDEHKISSLIKKDFGTNNLNVCISSITFSFDENQLINPYFIWVLESKNFSS